MPRDPSAAQFSPEALDAFLDGLRAELRNPADPALLNNIRAAFRKKIPFHLRSYAAAILIMRAAGLSRGVPVKPASAPSPAPAPGPAPVSAPAPKAPEAAKAQRRIVTSSDPSTRPTPRPAARQESPASDRDRSSEREHRGAPTQRIADPSQSGNRRSRTEGSLLDELPADFQPVSRKPSRQQTEAREAKAQEPKPASREKPRASRPVAEPPSVPAAGAATQPQAVPQAPQSAAAETPQTPAEPAAPRVRRSYSLSGPALPLFVSMGRRQRLRATELREFFMDKAGLVDGEVGQVRLFDNYCFIDVLAEKAQMVSDTLNGLEYRGRPISVGQAKPRGEVVREDTQQRQPAASGPVALMPQPGESGDEATLPPSGRALSSLELSSTPEDEPSAPFVQDEPALSAVRDYEPPYAGAPDSVADTSSHPGAEESPAQDWAAPDVAKAPVSVEMPLPVPAPEAADPGQEAEAAPSGKDSGQPA